MRKRILLFLVLITCLNFFYARDTKSFFSYKPDSIINSDEKGYLFTADNDYGTYTCYEEYENDKWISIYIYDGKSPQQEKRALDLQNFYMDTVVDFDTIPWSSDKSKLANNKLLKSFDRNNTIFGGYLKALHILNKYNLDLQQSAKDNYLLCGKNKSKRDKTVELDENDVSGLANEPTSVYSAISDYLCEILENENDKGTKISDTYLKQFLKEYNLGKKYNLVYGTYGDFYDFLEDFENMIISEIMSELPESINKVLSSYNIKDFEVMIEEYSKIKTTVQYLCKIYDINYETTAISCFYMDEKKIFRFNDSAVIEKNYGTIYR